MEGRASVRNHGVGDVPAAGPRHGDRADEVEAQADDHEGLPQGHQDVPWQGAGKQDGRLEPRAHGVPVNEAGREESAVDGSNSVDIMHAMPPGVYAAPALAPRPGFP